MGNDEGERLEINRLNCQNKMNGFKDMYCENNRGKYDELVGLVRRIDGKKKQKGIGYKQRIR